MTSPKNSTVEAIKYRLHCIKQNILFRTTDAGRASAAALSALKDQHRGKRCFILGNGPSLRHLDLGKLKNEITFGMNRFYLMLAVLDERTAIWHPPAFDAYGIRRVW